MTLQASSSSSYSLAILAFTAISARPYRRLAVCCQVDPSEKSIEIMRKFSEQYARKSGTYFCVDKGVTSVVIKTVRRNLKLDARDAKGKKVLPSVLTSLVLAASIGVAEAVVLCKYRLLWFLLWVYLLYVSY
ncbi:hypothetical protein QQ045_021281 [Rhodiola kirilowii]